MRRLAPALAVASWAVLSMAHAAPHPGKKPQAPVPEAAPPKLGSEKAGIPAAPAPAFHGADEPSLDFDLLGDGASAARPRALDPTFEARVARRRTMLQMHQALGLATWAGLAATEIVGQLNFNDKYRAGGDTGRWNNLHLGLAVGTSTLFVSVALLGVLAPEPFEKHARFDTATVHKTMMGMATAGMFAQVLLGFYAKSREGHLDQRDFAAAHQVIGYTTLGAMSVGAATLFF